MVRMTGKPHGFDITISDPVKRIQRFIDIYVNDESYKGFEAVLMRNIRVISAESAPSSQDGWTARALFELEAVPALCNPMENMHGGAVALIADMATTMAAAPVSTKSFWQFGGVSRSLNVTFLAPMPMHSVVEIDCKLVSAGKRLSLIHCEFRDKTSKAVLAVGEHGKVAAGVQVREAQVEKGPKL